MATQLMYYKQPFYSLTIFYLVQMLNITKKVFNYKFCSKLVFINKNFIQKFEKN